MYLYAEGPSLTSLRCPAMALWGSGMRSWWVDIIALPLVPKQVLAAAVTIMSDLIWYCSIDLLPPHTVWGRLPVSLDSWQVAKIHDGHEKLTISFIVTASYCMILHSFLFLQVCHSWFSWRNLLAGGNFLKNQLFASWARRLSTTLRLRRRHKHNMELCKVCILHFFNLLQAVIMYWTWRK